MPRDQTAADLDELLRKARTARGRFEPNWFMNLAYYSNRQWLAWNGRELYQPQMPKARITHVDNRITPIVRKEVARMTKNRPVFTVTPNTADQMDTNASDLGEQLMRDLWIRLKLQTLTVKALRWSRICGAGFLKTFWDATVGESTQVLVSQPTGKLISHPQTGRPMTPDEMPNIAEMPGVVVKTVARGEIAVEVRSPFQMYVDPLADSFQEAEWLIDESVKSAEYVLQRYGVEVSPDTNANPGLVEARMSGAGAYAGGTSSSYKGVRVREYWCKPNTNHPQGYRAVWVISTSNKKTNSKLLLQEDGPFDCQPYVMFSSIPVPGRLWPMSVVDLLRDPQTERNKIKSQIAENRSRVGNPTLLVSKQAVQDAEKLVNSIALPGGILFYDDVGSPNAKPDVLPAPALPDYVIESLQDNEESMQEISGQHEVTSAQTPPGVTAASAIQLLQEADDTMLGPDMTDFEEQLAGLGNKMLQLVARYYTDSRAIRIAGDNGSWQIFDFRGAMLRDNTHVEVQAGSAFPQSKAAKQAWIQNLLDFFVQSGNPPQGRQLAQFLQDSQIGGAERLVEQFTTSEQQVNRENLIMDQGTLIGINPYDDDAIHIDGHQEHQREVHFQQMPLVTQQNQIAHTEMHKQRLQQQQQQQAQAQAQAQETPAQQQQAAQQGQLAALQQASQSQQIQGDQQQQLQEQLQQMLANGQQSGFQQSAQQQSQRHAEELHQQQMAQNEQLHQARLQSQQQNGR